MMSFVGRIKPVMSISYHSYSEIVIYPLALPRENTFLFRRKNHRTIGKTLAGKLEKDSGRGTNKSRNRVGASLRSRRW